jgi:hypothetical protein
MFVPLGNVDPSVEASLWLQSENTYLIRGDSSAKTIANQPRLEREG